MMRPTWIEVNLQAIAQNVQLLRKRAASPRLMAVVKADGYGHGAVAVGKVALENGADMLGVAIAEEGVQLREAGIEAPILVLGGIAQAGAEGVAAYGLSQAVFDIQTVQWLAAAAVKVGKCIDVHIKVDTGMGRIGVRDSKSLIALAEAIQAEPSLRLAGIFTHFATADGDDPAYVLEQHQRFLPLVQALKQMAPEAMVHAANSAATLRFSQTHHDMVRTGISLYLDQQLPEGASAGLKPAMRWLTRAVHVKEVEAGESISYGRIFSTDRPSKIMTLPIGYADGYHRCIGNRGYVLVHGKKAPVIGRVCMDQCMVDVSAIEGACVGDEVVLLGEQNSFCISAQEMGQWCNMIDYEIVLSPSKRVPRIYLP